MLTSEDITTIVNKATSFLFAQSPLTIFMLLAVGYVGYLLSESEARNETLQSQLIGCYQEQRQLLQEGYEKRINDFKK